MISMFQHFEILKTKKKTSALRFDTVVVHQLFPGLVVANLI